MTVKKVRERDIIKMKDNIMLLIDIGSTFTKVVVVDLDSEEIISRIASPSMVREDVTIGIRKALGKVEEEIGNLKGKEIIACSSAAGGLQVVSIRVQ
jgi:activator of 2-hydroxyglutaryl-CoA dehydratase